MSYSYLYKFCSWRTKSYTRRSRIEWLSPRALAFWSMDDGSLSESGFYLNTLSYTLDEHVLLQKALQVKFNIETNIHKHGTKYKLYIKAKSMNQFRSIVLPYFAAHRLIFI
uniref:LAGLIDADG homing endonuclease n=1 Tax=Phanerochaete carnosa TaxID=231932 RepID=A0A895KX20_9APHY|nr:LAGLIDADG homing endonuclease [Phanerochaete carnosa]QRZ60374.1 LAGLIDADG homing endonuclease [Phanerochaete carnosa]